MPYEDCKLVVVVQNAGGEGKSTWTEALVALGTIAGLNPVVFDADPGMRGFRNRSGGEGLIELSWSESHAAGEDGTHWCEKHYADRKMVLIDTGANFFSATHRVQSYLSEVVGAAIQLGIKVAFHVVVGTNKAGSFRGAVEFHRQLSQQVDVVLVRNNRDGSGEFGEDKLGPSWTATIDIPHLSAGLQAYRLSRAEPLLGILRKPTPGYAVASALLAQWLLQIAKVDHVKSIFGTCLRQELEELSASAPTNHLYVLNDLASVKDDKLLANAAVFRATCAFRAASPDSEGPAFTEAAKELWRAERTFLSLTT